MNLQSRKCADCGSVDFVEDRSQGDLVCTVGSAPTRILPVCACSGHSPKGTDLQGNTQGCGLVAESHIIDETAEWRSFADTVRLHRPLQSAHSVRMLRSVLDSSVQSPIRLLQSCPLPASSPLHSPLARYCLVGQTRCRYESSWWTHKPTSGRWPKHINRGGNKRKCKCVRLSGKSCGLCLLSRVDVLYKSSVKAGCATFLQVSCGLSTSTSPLADLCRCWQLQHH